MKPSIVPSEMMTPISDMAVIWLSVLEHEGAIVTLNEYDRLRVDLDGIQDFKQFTPELVAKITLGLSDQIRQILIARRMTKH